MKPFTCPSAWEPPPPPPQERQLCHGGMLSISIHQHGPDPLLDCSCPGAMMPGFQISSMLLLSRGQGGTGRGLHGSVKSQQH